MDGSLENFSGIFLYDNNDNLVAEGWMDFVHSGDFFIAYWKFLSVFEGGKEIVYKGEPGIPDHIWNLIPSDIQPLYKRERL